MMKKGTALVQVQTLDNQHPLSPLMPHTPHLFLQLGAFGLKQNAIDLKKQLQKQTHRPVRIHIKKNHGMTLYLVQVGPLKGVGESDKLRESLLAEGHPVVVSVVV